jgi:tRNA-2-methylthio-N6-dimethylallyladenosine synthase
VNRSYAIRTYGCQMNEHDSERLAGLLEADGLEPALVDERADVIVLNTCCIRENADNKLYAALGDLKAEKRDRPELQLVVAGCLAQKDRELIRDKAPHVDVVMGTHNVHRVVELLDGARHDGPVVEILEEAVVDDREMFPSALPAVRQSGYAAWVTIQIGCDNSCAFCIVPSVRGREISRAFGEIVAEVERLAAEGVVEITLLGQNVNSYGRDLTTARRGETADAAAAEAIPEQWRVGERWVAEPGRRPRPLFADLLRSVSAVEGIRRVRYTSPHPKDLRADTIDVMAEVPEVCPHLHLPLQSGSNRVLAAMHRGYTAERYLERLGLARATVPDLAVTTDLIVGFPGETEADFESTLEVCAEAAYDSAFTFVYSPRAGTEAAELADRFVPREVAAERMKRLRVVVERSGTQQHRARIGRVEEVIVEGPSKRDPDVLTGRTAQNKLVHFAAAEPIRVGSFAEVRVVESGRFHLRGELLAVTGQPRHRTRIPVVAV